MFKLTKISKLSIPSTFTNNFFKIQQNFTNITAKSFCNKDLEIEKWIHELQKINNNDNNTNDNKDIKSISNKQSNQSNIITYEIYRIDTHGVEYIMWKGISSKERAEIIADYYENKGHHQGYFVRQSKENI